MGQKPSRNGKPSRTAFDDLPDEYEPPDEDKPDDGVPATEFPKTQRALASVRQQLPSVRKKLARRPSLRSFRRLEEEAPERRLGRDFYHRKRIHTRTWTRTDRWRDVLVAAALPLAAAGLASRLLGLGNAGLFLYLAAAVVAWLNYPLVLGRIGTIVVGKVMPNDRYNCTSARVSAWLAADDGSPHTTGDRRLYLECVMGGLFCRDETMARPDADDAGYLYAAESGRVVVSFGRAELDWMATTASAFLRNVGEAARQKLRGGGMPVDWGAWPATPFIVRMDACDFMDCEGVVKVEPGSLELNYRKFKRLIAESVVRREYGKWAPKRSDGRPWPLPNRVEVRCRSFVGRAAPLSSERMPSQDNIKRSLAADDVLNMASEPSSRGRRRSFATPDRRLLDDALSAPDQVEALVETESPSPRGGKPLLAPAGLVPTGKPPFGRDESQDETSARQLESSGVKRLKTASRRPVVIVRVRELAVKTAKGCGDDRRAAFASRFALPLPDVGAQIAFDVDSDRAMKQRAKGKSKGLAGTWSIRGRDLVAVVLETTHGQPLATSDVASAYARVPPKLLRRFGMVSGRAATLLDANGNLVMALDARVRTNGVFAEPEAPAPGVLDVAIRLLRDPRAPSLGRQLAEPTRRIEPMEQLALQLAENKRYSALRPEPVARFAVFEVRSFRVHKVRLQLSSLFEKATDDGKHRSRESRSVLSDLMVTKKRPEMRDEDSRLAKRDKALYDKRVKQLTKGEVFYVPLMDLSGSLRERTAASAKRTLSALPTTQHFNTFAKEYLLLSQKQVERAVIGEGMRQLKDDSYFGWHIASRIFGYGGAASQYAYRHVWMESLSGRAFRYRAQVVGASVKETFFHSKIRAKHVYAETPEDIPRLLAPVYFDASGWRARGYFHKRAHMTVMGMGGWRYCYAALHVAPDGPVLFYGHHTPCLNRHGFPITDPYVLRNGGTSATGPLKKLTLVAEAFDLVLDERASPGEGGVEEGCGEANANVVARIRNDVHENLARRRAATGGVQTALKLRRPQADTIDLPRAKDVGCMLTIKPVERLAGRHKGWCIQLKSAKSHDDTRRLFRALMACQPRAAKTLQADGDADWGSLLETQRDAPPLRPITRHPNLSEARPISFS